MAKFSIALLLSLVLQCFVSDAFKKVCHKFSNKYHTSTITGQSVLEIPLTIQYYDYLGKKGNDEDKRKDPKRLIKNMLFPGIYQTYEDTKEALPTVKVDTSKLDKKKKEKDNIFNFNKKGFVRNDVTSFFSQSAKSGTYNVVDPSTVPKVISMSQVKDTLKSVSKPKGFVAPTPKKATITVGGLDVLPGLSARPLKPIILYESEASGESKQVREVCSLLDLTVEIRPCPGATSGFSDIMSTATLGKRQIPYMVDNNPSMYRPELFGSKEIIQHLWDTYAPAGVPLPSKFKGGPGLSFGKGKLVRKDARYDNNRMKPITLYGWEGAQYVKPVREALDSLGLAHVLINCAKGSRNRAKLEAKTKTFQVPYIQDPNTGVEMFESAEIVKYLEETYTV